MSTTPEAYVHLSEDQTTLTFYYDSLRADRDGKTWGIRDPKEDYEDYRVWRLGWSPAWTSGGESHTTVLTAVFDASFQDFRPTSMKHWFQSFRSLKIIEGLEHLNTSQVTSMGGMFSGCLSLTSLDFSRFDTSEVTDMREMFFGCSSLTSLDLSRFNTSQVTDMSSMFSGCASFTALDLSRFDTSK
ncbi:MAG: BspA family leucine-rich repeat surface protein, partial [Porphyromonas sp.]|nr:BspA family leucine-rich repeat surface protein [Porphyromonas sp.]